MTHPELVRSLCKPGKDILASLTPEKAHLLHMASKLCSEAGELMDAIGKHVYYERDLDLHNVVEELGDLEFYMQGLRDGLGLTREQTITANIAKLSIRYSKGHFTNEQAKARQDKELNWEKAEQHLTDLEHAYRSLIGAPNVNPGFAVTCIANLRNRFTKGERSAELYQEIMNMSC